MLSVFARLKDAVVKKWFKKNWRRVAVEAGVLLLVLLGVWFLQAGRDGLLVSDRVSLVSEPEVYIASEPAPDVIEVPEKELAEKIDLERKIIAPSTGADVARIETVVEASGGEVLRSSENVVVAIIPKDKEETITETLEEGGNIKGVEVDYPTRLAVDNPDWGVERIEAPAVWETTTAEGIRIAVVDTGMDYGHPDLQGRFAGGIDTYNNDNDPYDDHGHGTHVSGTIASNLNDAGLAGVAPRASILAVKALSGSGTGYISDLVEAVHWAMNNGAQVMNFSLGTTYNSPTLEAKINEAAGRGIYLVAAAGNDYGGPLLFPAAYSSVIAVAATDSSDRLASFSNLGAEVAAPGVSIASTIPGGGYATWSGTSMAAPHVTATVALMVANNQENVRQNLRDTAIDLGPGGVDNYFGHGLVHAKPAALGKDTQAPVVTFVSPDHRSQVGGVVEVKVDIQDEHRIVEANLLISSGETIAWEEPYIYSWDTTELEGGRNYVLVAQAVDEFNNLGEAQVAVAIRIEPTATATLTPTIEPSPTATPTATLTPTKEPEKPEPEDPDDDDGDDITPTPTLNRGKSEGVRQDRYQRAEERRRNYEQLWRKTEEVQRRVIDELAPETSNYRQRNRRLVEEKVDELIEKSEKTEKAKGKGRGLVKGVATGWWEWLVGLWQGRIKF